MNLFNFPSKKLLQKYQLSQYISVSEACIQGNMSQLEDSIDDNMQDFVQTGVYLAIEKLRMIALRNFFKKVALAVKKEPSI